MELLLVQPLPVHVRKLVVGVVVHDVGVRYVVQTAAVPAFPAFLASAVAVLP
jgi:hypothetical protein